MKNAYKISLSLAFSLILVSCLSAARVHAQSADGNPIGSFETASCSTLSGWTYDPDTTTGTPDPGTPTDPGTPGTPGNPGTPGDPGTPTANTGGAPLCFFEGTWVYHDEGGNSNGNNGNDFGVTCRNQKMTGFCQINSVTSGLDRGLHPGNYTCEGGSVPDTGTACDFDGTWAYNDEGGPSSGEGSNDFALSCKSGRVSGFCTANTSLQRGYHPGSYSCGDSSPLPACPYDGTWTYNDEGGGNDFAVTCRNSSLTGWCGATPYGRGPNNGAYACETPYTYSGGSGGSNHEVLLNLETGIKRIVALFMPTRLSANSGSSNSVEIYEGPKGSGSLLAVVAADESRPDVNAVMGVSGNHGFSWAPPAALKDGQPHDIYIYGTDIEAPGSTSLLSGAPRTIQCAPGSTNTPPSAPTLSCPANGSSTNSPLDVSFKSTDNEGDAVRYLIDWDANGTTDEIVPAGGAYVAANTTQSSSKTWTSAGLQTVRVSAQDDQGEDSTVSSCSFTLDDGSTTDGGGGDGGSGGSGGTGGGTAQGGGFTIAADKSTAQVQFLASLSGTSETVRVEANPVGSFSSPVTLRLVSVLSKASGSNPPDDVTVTASFDGKPFGPAASTVQTFDGNLGRYRGEEGLVGSSFRVTFSKAVSEPYIATIEGVSGSKSAVFYLTLDPKSTTPIFKEI